MPLKNNNNSKQTEMPSNQKKTNKLAPEKLNTNSYNFMGNLYSFLSFYADETLL